jgi:hypothetical protein
MKPSRNWLGAAGLVLSGVAFGAGLMVTSSAMADDKPTNQPATVDLPAFGDDPAKPFLCTVETASIDSMFKDRIPPEFATTDTNFPPGMTIDPKMFAAMGSIEFKPGPDGPVPADDSIVIDDATKAMLESLPKMEMTPPDLSLKYLESLPRGSEAQCAEAATAMANGLDSRPIAATPPFSPPTTSVANP